MAANSYERKISSEEAAEGYILVEKAALNRFAPIGEPFDLSDGHGRATATVEARDCTCRGPEKPHQHYFIRRGGLAKGETVRLTRDAAGYTIEARGTSA